MSKKKGLLLSQVWYGAVGVAVVFFSGGYYVGNKAGLDTVNQPPFATFSPLSTAQPSSTPPPTDDHGDFTFDNIMIRFNEMRLANGLKQLGTDSFLSKQAASDLDGNCPVTSHEPFRQKEERGVFRSYKAVGEVLHSGSVTPKEAIESLMSSPTHRDGMLNTEINAMGIGIATEPVNCVSIVFAIK